jgi:hypothetical protein
VRYISALIEEIEERLDKWLIFELGGEPLSKCLFEVKGEFHKGERIYQINHQPFLQKLKESKAVLKDFLKKLI